MNLRTFFTIRRTLKALIISALLQHGSKINANTTDSIRYDSLVGIGLHYTNVQYDSAVKYFKQAHKLALKMNSLRRLAGTSNQIGLAYKKSGKIDSAMVYYHLSLDYHQKLMQTDTVIAKNMLKGGIAACYYNLGIVYSRQSKYIEANDYIKKAQEIYEELNDTSGIALIYVNLGANEFDIGHFENALKYNFKALELFKSLENDVGIAAIYNNIGEIFEAQNEPETALDYYEKSLSYEIKAENISGIGVSYVNIGHVQYILKKKDEALKNYSLALKQFEDIGDRSAKAHCLLSVSEIYIHDGNYGKASENLHVALSIFKSNNEAKYVSRVLANLAELYTVMADSLAVNSSTHSHYLKKSVDYALEGLKNAVAAEGLKEKVSNIKALISGYDKLHNIERAYFYSKELLRLKDTLFEEDKLDAINEMQTKYKTEAKQLQIEKLIKEKSLDEEVIARKSAENKKQRTYIGSLVIVLLLIGFLLFTVNRQNSIKKKTNQLLTLQKQEILEKNEELKIQNEEIAAQREQIGNQNDILKKQNTKIQRILKRRDESIFYARKIQNALMPDDKALKETFSDYFIFYQPLEQVSGDFYWAIKEQEKIILAVADCTGHGVPGGFMSMLGISFLSEIIKSGNHNAADILGQMRSRIIQSFKQKGELNEQKDGMEMALCIIDCKTHELTFAGAISPLLLVRSKDSLKPVVVSDEIVMLEENEESCMYKVIPDFMPVAYHEKIKPFENKKLNVSMGDCIYFYSDGFIDQFGGEKSRKFMTKPFYKLLLANSKIPMEEQGKHLHKVFNEFKGDNSQVDDVLVMGIRF